MISYLVFRITCPRYPLHVFDDGCQRRVRGNAPVRRHLDYLAACEEEGRAVVLEAVDAAVEDPLFELVVGADEVVVVGAAPGWDVAFEASGVVGGDEAAGAVAAEAAEVAGGVVAGAGGV